MKSAEAHQEQAEVQALKAQIARMRSALQVAEDYFDDRADVKDGSYGQPEPNTEMTILSEIREALGRAA